MNKIAFLYGDRILYWSAIVMVLAVLTGIVLFLAACLRGSDKRTGAIAVCPLAILLSLVLARLIHWYFRADSYESLQAAMTEFSGTGYALMGAFAGCLLAAGVMRLLKAVRNLPALLDCMSVGGCAAIALGRLSSFFTSEDRGEILQGVTDLPWVSPIVNTASGLLEYRFATFLFQAVIAGCIFVILFVLYWKKHRDGDIALLFLLFYCASQIVLDSTRYDSLRLRSNGFISIVQILCAFALILVAAVFSSRLLKNTGWKLGYLGIWILLLLGLTGAGYMEYYVQRHGDQACFAYLGMSGCLGVVVLLGVFLRGLADRSEYLPAEG